MSMLTVSLSWTMYMPSGTEESSELKVLRKGQYAIEVVPAMKAAHGGSR